MARGRMQMIQGWLYCAVAATWAGVIVASAAGEDRCTAILVGAKASATGTPMTTHSMDCSSCDFRLAKVPEQHHETHALHYAVLPRHEYPRYVGDARGNVYKRENLDKRFYNWSDTPAIGSIPEVATTFAYLDASYGIINEHQVVIGESTCGARFISKPRSQGGEALFDVSALTRIALGRSKTAREAIQIMGDLAVEHGFYGIKWEGDIAIVDAGEALTVTDTKEAWMFHILPDDTGRSAIWAAQRIPDDHVAVVANQFVIHELDLSNTDFFMASKNVVEVAIRNNLWPGEDNEPFDFTKVYSHPRDEGLQHYSSRRVWRVFTLVNPSIELSPYTDVYSSDYPVSVKAAKLLTPHDLMRFHRDHYEGTAFDMTKGRDGGPFGDPDRYDSALNGDLTPDDLRRGHFERAISIFRTTYSFVSVLNASNPDNALIWFSQYAPHSSYYVPVFVKSTEVSSQHSQGSLLEVDHDSAFWISALVGNWAGRFYKYAHPMVETVQLQLEQLTAESLPDILDTASYVKSSQGESSMRQYLTSQSKSFAQRSHAAFWQLFADLVTSFHDGYQITDTDSAQLNLKRLFYPKWWLQQVGYFHSGSSSSPSTSTATGSTSPSRSISVASYLSTVFIALLSCAIGAYVGKLYYAPHLLSQQRRRPAVPKRNDKPKKQVRLVPTLDG